LKWATWAGSAALPVVESLSQYGLKSSNTYNSSTMIPNLEWIGSLKATIHIYSLKKFQKLQELQYLTVACPKVQKAVLAAFIL
jgi:hypothetical protein